MKHLVILSMMTSLLRSNWNTLLSSSSSSTHDVSSQSKTSFLYCQAFVVTSSNHSRHAKRSESRNSQNMKHFPISMVLNTPESIIEKASTQHLLDELIDESTRLSARRPIMLQFDPTGIRIWGRWRGTIFAETWPACVRNMLIAVLVAAFFRCFPAYKDRLQGFSILWGQLLSVATFTLTFFVNQSFGLWRKCYEYSRRLQGRLNDLGLTLAAHATRAEPSREEELEAMENGKHQLLSTYTPEAKQVLQLVARYIRLFNLLTYASFTRSHRPILTPSGMRRMVERGLMTQQEKDALTQADVAATQRHNGILLWIVSVFNEARRAGHIQGGPGFEQQFVEKIHVIRAQYGAIGDELQGRMPLAYAHIVQVLVDTILWMYPFMAFSSNMSPTIGVLGCGLLTMFYQGLVDLAKQFLDPYDNENYGRGYDPICVDTLIAETNAGSVRWMNAFEFQPWSARGIRHGKMNNVILPIRGYSLKELQAIKDEEQNSIVSTVVASSSLDESIKKEERNIVREEIINGGTGSYEEPIINGDSDIKGLGDLLDNEAMANDDGDILLSNTGRLNEPDEASNKTELNLSHLYMTSTDHQISERSESIVVDEKKTFTSIHKCENSTSTLPEPVRPLTVEEFEKETAEIVAAVEKEILETEAILNAPPGADSVEVENEEDNDYEFSSFSTAEGTDKDLPSEHQFDTQEVYEAAKERMVQSAIELAGLSTPGIFDLARKAEEIIEKAEEESMETEAILGAPPGAESVDFCDNDDEECINELLSKGVASSDILPESDFLYSGEGQDSSIKQNIISENEVDLLGLDDSSIQVNDNLTPVEYEESDKIANTRDK